MLKHNNKGGLYVNVYRGDVEQIEKIYNVGVIKATCIQDLDEKCDVIIT